MITRRLSKASFPRSCRTEVGMTSTFRLAVAVLLLIGVGIAWSEVLAQGSSFKVVVNDSNSAESLSKSEVSRLFLKKDTRWKSGFKASPVDQLPQSKIRAEFSDSIHSKKIDWVKKYWNKLIFSGRLTPPPELESDRQVLEYVRRNVGAVGYVSARTALGEGVKRLRITD